MTAWLGVVSADHVRGGCALGIAQISHGARGPLARMLAGDSLTYYSPTERRGDINPLRAFTAIAMLPDDEIWQADEGVFRPYRRHANYLVTVSVPLEEVRADLHLTSEPNWGYQLRRGLIPLAPNDADLLRERMVR